MKKILSLLSCCFLFISVTSAQSLRSIQNSAGWTPGGMYYELYSRATGDSAREGNVLKLRTTQKLNDSIIYDPGKMLIPVYQQVGAVIPYDFSELWQKLKSGDSLYVVQLMDTFILRNPDLVLSKYKKGDSIKSFIKVLEIFKDDSLAMADMEKEKARQLQKEIAFITSYLGENKIKATKTASGAFAEIITEGTGSRIDSGSIVFVMYNGMTLEGIVFVTNMDDSFGHTEPLEVTTGPGTYIKGFEEGLAMLREGSVAKIYIPSMLGYGTNPLPNIEPMTNLLYEVKIISVKK